MKSRQNEPDKTKLKRQLILTALVMFMGMVIYEALKQIVFPNITVWQSHIVTILFGTGCATIAAFFVIRRLIETNSILVSKIIESERFRQELEITVEQLEAKNSEVKSLTGLLPICAACKKIRDDQGYWNQIESYIAERSEVDFSHSICPVCAKKLYPQIS